MVKHPQCRVSRLLSFGLGPLLSRTSAGGRLLILTYHRILQRPDPIFPDATDIDAFTMQMACLRDGFRILPLPEAAARLREGSLPSRSACVTFDDGYADNFTVALPVLRELAVPATFFIAAGFLDGGRMWNDTVIEAVRRARPGRIDLKAADMGEHDIAGDADRRSVSETLLKSLKYLPPDRRDASVAAVAEIVGAELPQDLMMTSGQVRELSELGMDVGAHTINHPILARLEPEHAEAEIAGSRRMLEEMTGRPVRSFAYPNGRPGADYRAEHVACVQRAGFERAVTTAWGAADPRHDPLQLPRIGCWDRSMIRFTLRLLSAYRTSPGDAA